MTVQTAANQGLTRPAAGRYLTPADLLAAARGDSTVVIAGHDARLKFAVERFALGVVKMIGTEHDAPAEIARAAVDHYLQTGGILAKGSVTTAQLARALLGARRDSTARLVHAAWVYDAAHKRAFVLADAGINLEPDRAVQVEIAARALELAASLGMEGGVAVLGHSDSADSRVQSSVRAAEWVETLRTDSRFSGIPVAGPISLDLALSRKARGVKHATALPDFDVLLAPDIVVGNVLFKAFMLAPRCVVTGVLLTRDTAVAVPSRANSPIEKALAVVLAELIARWRQC
jgi:phosphotransacetylase